MSILTNPQEELLVDLEGLEAVLGKDPELRIDSTQDPEDKESTETTEIQTARGQIVSRTTRVEPLVDIAEGFDRLDRVAQARAYIGHIRTISLRPLPKGTRAITLTAKRRDLHTVEEALTIFNLTRQVGQTSVYSALDTLARKQLIVPAGVNALHLLDLAQKQGLNIDLLMADDDNALSLSVGSTHSLLHPHLHSAEAITGNMPEGSRLTILDQYGNPSVYEDTKTPGESAKFWSPQSSSAQAIQSAKEQDYTLPENLNGSCQYLVIDPNLLLNTPANLAHLRPILNQIIALSSSSDFYTTTDESGNIVLINLSPRGGSYIEILADSLHKATNKQLSLFTGRGEIHRISEEKFTITNYPIRRQLAKIKEEAQKNPRILSRKHDKEANEAGRDATTAQSTATPVKELAGIVEISDIRPEAKLDVGAGPRDFIGYKREMAQFKQATSFTSKTKLVLLKGQAGLGKSRMLKEWLKENPNAIVVSIDAAGEKVPGQSLVTVANQIAAKIRSRLPDHPLLKFADKDEATKLKTSNTQAYKISNMCISALLAYENLVGNFHLLVDDVHHTDGDSDSEVMTIIQQFLENARGSKAIMAMRPEERFKSKHQKDLERAVQDRFGTKREDFGQNPVEEISLEWPGGKPKLNLQDPEIAHQYVTSSLPEDWLTNRQGEKRHLVNDWHLKLVGTSDSPKARTPLDLTSLLNILLRNRRNFIFTDKGIDLTEKALAMIEKIKNTEDIAREEKRRLQMLKRSTKTLLYAIALLGRSVTRTQLAKLGAVTSNQDATRELLDNKYLFLEEDGYRLQHDTTRTNILQSIPANERKNLALQIFEMFKEDTKVHTDVKFALLQHAVNHAKESDVQFWRDYCETTQTSLQDAQATNGFRRAFSLAITVLDNLSPRSRSKMAQLRSQAERGEHVAPAIKALIVDSLMAIAENGGYIGQRQQVYTAIASLETLNIDQDTMDKAYMYGFNAAYIPPSDTKKMQDYKAKIANTGTDEFTIATIKLEYQIAAKKQNPETIAACFTKFPQRNELIAMKRANPEAFMELQRLHERIKLEHHRKNLIATNVDEDVILAPGYMETNSAKRLLGTKTRLNGLYTEKKANRSNFKPVEELFLTEQLAQTCAFLGHYEEALEFFSELWRLANQFDIHELSARAAKLKGDIEMIMAKAEITATNDQQNGDLKQLPGGTILRTKVLDAIETYTEQGLDCARHVPENEYNSILHVQRLRAVATLAISYKLEIAQAEEAGDEDSKSRIKEELLPYLQLGLKDFEFLNFESPWKQHYQSDSSGEFSYYIDSSINPILDVIKKLGIARSDVSTDIPSQNAEKYPLLDPKVIEFGKVRAKRMQDKIGESAQKAAELEQLAQAA